MCSKRCANPVRPGGSLAEPTWYHRLTATIGAVWSSESVTNNPFCSRKVSMGTRIRPKLVGPVRMDNVRRGLRRVSSILTVLLVVAFVWVTVLVVLLWRNQERVVFQPPNATPAAPTPARKVVYRASDGQELFGYVLDAPTGNGAR